MNKDKFSKFALPLFWVFAFLVIIFMISFTSFAAGEDTVIQTSLPYYINPNNFQFTNTDFFIAYDNTSAGGRYNSILSQFDTKKYLVVFEEYALGGEIYTYYQINTNNGLSLNGVSYADFNPMNNTLTWSFSAYKLKFIYRDGVLAHTSTTATDTDYVINLLGFDSQTYGADPLLIKETEYWLESPVLVLGAVPSVDVISGSAVPPMQGHSIGNFSNSDYTGSGQLPRENVPPQYTINNYTWTTVNPPAFDNSSTIDALESLGDINKYYFEWLADNLKNEFENLIDNIEGFFNYIGSLISYYGDLIIDNIQALAQNIYDNFKSLIEPIFEKLEYFTEPLNINAVETELTQTSFYSLYTTAGSFKNTYKNYFDNIPQISTLSFTVPFSILTKSGYVTFDFNWYANIRNDILPWIVGFLYAGFGLALFRSIPSIIHGVSGVLQKGG